MGIFKKNKQEEIVIRPGTSDADREAEKLRQLEASLDFLRDQKRTDAAAVKQTEAVKTIETGTIKKEAEPEKKTENGKMPQPAPRENMASMHSSADVDKQEKVSAEKHGPQPEEKNVIVNGNPVSHPAVQIPSLPKNRYGKRMDYKTAIVSGSSTVRSEAKMPAAGTEGRKERTEKTLTNSSHSDQTVAEDAKVTVKAEGSRAERQENAKAEGSRAERQENAKAEGSRAELQGNAKAEGSHAELQENAKAEAEAEGRRAELQENAKTEKKLPEEKKEKRNEEKQEKEEQKAEGKPAAAPIPNPLKTPPKHIPRELEFDFTPEDKEMHFDLVDLSGRDFFDIN